MQHRVKRNPSRNKVFESMEISLNPAGQCAPAGDLFRVLVVKKSHVLID